MKNYSSKRLDDRAVLPILSRRKLLASGGILATLTVLPACNHEVSNGIDKSKQRAVKRSGLDLSNIDLSTKPQDDLYNYVNGRWLKEYQIPEDMASYGTFKELYLNSVKELHRIIRQLLSEGPGDNKDNQHIITLYKNYTDINARNNNGFLPLTQYFKDIDTAKTKTDLLKTTADLNKLGVDGLFDLSISPDLYDSKKYSVYINQSGTTLPTKTYYLDDKYSDIQASFRSTMSQLFGLAGFAEPDLLANQVYELEKKIAKAQWSPEQLRDVDKNYTAVTFKGLYTNAPKYDWKAWLDTLTGKKYVNATLVMCQPSFLSAAAEIWADTPLNELKNWMKWNVIKARCNYLSEEVSAIAFNFFKKTLNGTPKPAPLWERGVNLVDEYFGEIIGKLYVKNNFSESDKSNINGLVNNILDAYRESLTNLEWMSPQTRNAAISKLDKINVKVGYPDVWKTFSDLKLSNSDIVKNISECNLYVYNKLLEKLGKPVDKNEWEMSPATVNAYYDPSKNEIVFPAAILQTPFFDGSVDPAVNYGGIGAVIGHEVGHGFDDQGSKFDGDGNRKDWWTDKDRKKFDEKTKMLIEQYNKLTWAEADNKRVNGALTVGENLADLGGLSIALRAYSIELAANNDKISSTNKIDNYSDLQRVFLNWGRIWRSKYRKETAIELIETDPHAPAPFRANQIARNIDDFYSAFEVKETDKMYLPPDKRIFIW